MFGRNKIAAVVAEFLGTGILTLLVLSVQRTQIGIALFVSIAAAVTLAMLHFAFSAASGAQFNPALTIALWVARKLDFLSAVMFVAVQLLGAWAAYGLYAYYAKSTQNPLQPIGGAFTYKIAIAEAVGTALFAFGYTAALYQGLSTATRAAVSGLSYMVGLIAASSAAIGLINPALALGVRAWVWGSYVAGPVVGALVGVLLYKYLFANLRPTLAVAGAAVTPVAVTTKTTVVKAPAAKATAATTARKPRKTATAKTTTRKTTTKKTAAKRTRK